MNLALFSHEQPAEEGSGVGSRNEALPSSQSGMATLNSLCKFDLDIYFRSMHDAQMKILFLQLR